MQFLTSGLDTFGISDFKATNQKLIEVVAKFYRERMELGAMRLSDTLNSLAQKCEAIHDGRSSGFWLRESFEQGVFDVLNAQGTNFRVKRDGDKLLPR